MGGFRHGQRRIEHRGRVFTFVSYEAHPASSRQPVAMPETWYLISSGNRWAAIPVSPEQPDPQVDVQLKAWLEAVVFGAVPAA